ncbi:nitronate monooxygenase [Lysinibacillus sp. MHQ-1]|nr:nitronate monooxygenase [Lysinibacillus sp. MHQ-1]
MTKKDIQKALESGAQAVQVGTALLVAEECEISPLYKKCGVGIKRAGNNHYTRIYGKTSKRHSK